MDQGKEVAIRPLRYNHPGLIRNETFANIQQDVSTQTYTRKVDLLIASAVAGLGSTAQKIAGDIRHLANWKEIEEPFVRHTSYLPAQSKS